ncbi:MAG: ParB/RepB/Spo0J family partition protein [Clostridia bacterium]|nr:ParB/RepB/Spo0J family partition protein [Clostridia bacterium]
MAVTRGLGKGFSALFNDYEENQPVEIDGSVAQIDITHIDRNVEQARKTFDEEALREMSASMEMHGVLQPLLLKPQTGERYLIIAGERRFRAALMAGLKTVPAIIKDLPLQQIKEISLIENLQREDLNAIEAAEGIKELMENHSLRQEDVATRLGKSRSYVANTMRLLNLPEEVLDMVRAGKLSSGHARAMITIDDQEYLLNLAKQTVQYKLTVREVEERVRLYFTRKAIPTGPRKNEQVSLELKEMVSDMKRIFGTRVKLAGNDNKGRFVIDYFSSDDLERIYQLIQILKLNDKL